MRLGSIERLSARAAVFVGMALCVVNIALAAPGQPQLNGPVLVKAMDRSLAHIVTACWDSNDDEEVSLPFLHSVADASRALRALEGAATARDARAFASAVSAMARTVEAVRTTHRLAEIDDTRITDGVETLNNSWRAFSGQYGEKLVPTAKFGDAEAQRLRELQASVGALEGELLTLKANVGTNAALAQEIDLILPQLQHAGTAGADAAGLWLALDIADRVAGWYRGYNADAIDLYPDAAGYFAAFDTHWVNFNMELAGALDVYYEGFSWAGYEETYVADADIDLDVTPAELSALDLESMTLVERAVALLADIEPDEQTVEVATIDATSTGEPIVYNPGMPVADQGDEGEGLGK